MAEFDRNKLIAEAKAKRAQIEAAAAALSDEQAYERAWMFPLWDGGGHAYAEGERVQYGGVLYRCLTGHTSVSYTHLLRPAGRTPPAFPCFW